MRFGIDMNTDHTLEEVGKQFDVTRERIRQIEAKALRKLRHPTRSGAAPQLPRSGIANGKSDNSDKKKGASAPFFYSLTRLSARTKPNFWWPAGEWCRLLASRGSKRQS